MRFLLTTFVALLSIACAQTCDPSQRKDCGQLGTNQQECESNGCCWAPVNPNPNNEPWCFFKSGPLPPGYHCNAGNRTVDCGRGNQNDCEAAGCCWKPESSGNWCFAKSPESPACSTSPQCSGNGKCVNGECQCSGQFQTCGAESKNDCSVNVQTDVNNCGGCGKVCPNGQNIASRTCASGQCKITCDAGYIECFGGCVKAANCSSIAPFSPDEVNTMLGYFKANMNNQCAGCVLASPSKAQPDYFYHWMRDGSISMNVLRSFSSIKDQSAMDLLMKWMTWTKGTQSDSDPNQINTLGEPKFFVSGKVFDGGWMRPQNDGPGLRATAMGNLALDMIAAGQEDYVKQNIWTDVNSPGIQKDLNYVKEIWSQDSGDPWEEIKAQVFFAKYSIRKGFLTGVKLAKHFNDQDLVQEWSGLATAIEKDIMANHWSSDKGIIMEIPNQRELDSAVHLGFLYGSNGDDFLSFTSKEVLSSVASLVSAFSNGYFQINDIDDRAGVPGILVGRYLHDTYNGGNSSQPGLGNPWILCSASLAETYYRSAQAHREQASITVTEYNQLYLQQVLSLSKPLRDGNSNALVQADLSAMQDFIGTLGATVTPTTDKVMFESLTNAMALSGDAILLRIRHHVQGQNFHCTEQINKDMGAPQGAQDLTWSYGTVLAAMQAREPAFSFETTRVPQELSDLPRQTASIY